MKDVGWVVAVEVLIGLAITHPTIFFLTVIPFFSIWLYNETRT